MKQIKFNVVFIHYMESSQNVIRFVLMALVHDWDNLI